MTKEQKQSIEDALIKKLIEEIPKMEPVTLLNTLSTIDNIRTYTSETEREQVQKEQDETIKYLLR